MEAAHGLVDLVFARGREALPRRGVNQPDRQEPVVAQLQADAALHVPAEDVAEPAIRQPPARGDPPLRLLELIAACRIVEKVREVGEQVEAVAQHEPGRPY